MTDEVEKLKSRYQDRDENLFDAWWRRYGESSDPDTTDVPWHDKRRGLAEAAFRAAMAMSRSYVADDSTFAEEFTFANGRIVRIDYQDSGDAFLRIGTVKS